MSKNAEAEESATVAEMCKCGANPAVEPHTCPYSEEINEDCESTCTCCADCEYQCCMDV